ncbi:MAG: hypothetical protein COU40_01295 [Candidatus Moranbacteria bacterium CG10_big_fil_rev_8_21_14_0_10_35_21]|nr:MAG: hypothetical protein COU40_01295 [Candidatus Moranbacteria bacterium CG10_big_fil_rev_8_21_14_0_10_35_21]PJA88391.1 MAG: hypothetical protein CO139_03360 [Candidatus Moranbacteria bacterium CG_4_9_14_3_um_filter_36_9]
MLRKILFLLVAICFTATLAGAGGSEVVKQVVSTVAEKWVQPNHGKALESPEIAKNLKLIDNPDSSKIIDFGDAKVEIYGVAIYGSSEGVFYARKLAEGKYELPYMRSFNVVVKGSDGNWHFLYISNDGRVFNIWDLSVGVFPDTGRGAKLTAPEWLKPEYR